MIAGPPRKLGRGDDSCGSLGTSLRGIGIASVSWDSQYWLLGVT